MWLQLHIDGLFNRHILGWSKIAPNMFGAKLFPFVHVFCFLFCSTDMFYVTYLDYSFHIDYYYILVQIAFFIQTYLLALSVN